MEGKMEEMVQTMLQTKITSIQLKEVDPGQRVEGQPGLEEDHQETPLEKSGWGGAGNPAEGGKLLLKDTQVFSNNLE